MCSELFYCAKPGPLNDDFLTESKTGISQHTVRLLLVSAEKYAVALCHGERTARLRLIIVGDEYCGTTILNDYCAIRLKRFETQSRGLHRYVEHFRGEYEARLEKYSVPTIRKKRCFGTVELTEVMLTDVSVKSTFSAINDGQYYLKIEHLHTSLHGSYKHNLLFIKNGGDFQQEIRDLNATLGPLVAVNIGGIPYLDREIPCNIRHTNSKIKLNGGILRWLAKKRLKDVLREDLDRILCDSLVGVLDEKIRRSLREFRFVVPINKEMSISYLLVGQPLPIRYGAIRTFHAGITSNDHHGTKFVPSLIESQHDVIYHIHEGLLSEVVQSVCNKGYMNGNLTTDEGQLQMACQKAAISVRNMEGSSSLRNYQPLSGRDCIFICNYSKAPKVNKYLQVNY
uniref:PAZ domain-containing protein n=1 Tax=Angiostrongylus cantonensis TaxID=6313 RepID=A0A158P9P1_ANGCA